MSKSPASAAEEWDLVIRPKIGWLDLHVRHLYWQRGDLRKSVLPQAQRTVVACHLQHDEVRDPVCTLPRVPDHLRDARRAGATERSDRPYPFATRTHGRSRPWRRHYC